MQIKWGRLWSCYKVQNWVAYILYQTFLLKKYCKTEGASIFLSFKISKSALIGMALHLRKCHLAKGTLSLIYTGPNSHTSASPSLNKWKGNDGWSTYLVKLIHRLGLPESNALFKNLRNVIFRFRFYTFLDMNSIIVRFCIKNNISITLLYSPEMSWSPSLDLVCVWLTESQGSQKQKWTVAKHN